MSYLIMHSHKEKGYNYMANISLNPKPNNCFECPFFFLGHPELKNTRDEDYKCFLTPINDWTGIAVKRYKDCPFDKEGKINEYIN